jgi:hypothetical protein
MEKLMLVDPKGALSVDFAKVVKVELTDQGLKAGVAEILRQSF